MKILIYVWRLTHGGAERVASVWAKGFAQKGYSVDFLLGSHSSPVSYEIPASSRVFYESPFNDKISARLIPDFYKKKRIRKCVSEVKPDVIICVMPSFGPRIKDSLGNDNHIPIIITDHNSFERPDYAPMSQKQWKSKFVDSKQFDVMTVLTDADKKFIGNRLSNVVVLPNPLPFSPVNEIAKKEKIIFAAGRLDAWHVKGFDLLIKAWGSIASRYPDWKLKIAGEGKKNCRDYLDGVAADNHCLDRIDFLGFVNTKEYFNKSEIFVLSSRYEGFGMALTEAMSQGCACISCDYKGRQREIIQNDSQGIICPVDNVMMLSSALEKMIVDGDYRKTCQKNAVERSKYFSLSNIMDRWENIFQKLNLKG